MVTFNLCAKCRFLILLSFFSFSIQAQKLDTDKIKNLNIRNIGPANMSGRITTIDAVNENPKIIYVGAASGGFGNLKTAVQAGLQYLMNNPHKTLVL